MVWRVCFTGPARADISPSLLGRFNAFVLQALHLQLRVVGLAQTDFPAFVMLKTHLR
jgi:hypothetical protein